MSDDELIEKLGRVLNRAGWTYEGIHEPGDYDTCHDCRAVADDIARAVLPIVRAAQHEAWEEGRAAGWADYLADDLDDWAGNTDPTPNPYPRGDEQ